MPRVGDRRFPYTPAGKNAAAAYARDVGRPVEGERDAPRNIYDATSRAVRDRRRRRELPANPADIAAQHYANVGREMRDALERLSPEDRRNPEMRRRLLEAMNREGRARSARGRDAERREFEQLFRQRGQHPTWGQPGTIPSGPDPDNRFRYGPWGYAGETRRQHEDRLWDRDWDEDWRGRTWDPRSPRAGGR